ncbi:hypothetical protein L2E82_24546 [Cichorium intybus]|uniref:Uncharacterized protein n=1 Tax=Cichorium intybus TaxID=13427 RepID=A0ACB9E160_CICIN|nr:hypothetical protein L2E82_24546 [Cichorium intybus]
MDLETGFRQNHLKEQSWRAVYALAYQSLCVLYGDLSTSPLYVYKNAQYKGLGTVVGFSITVGQFEFGEAIVFFVWPWKMEQRNWRKEETRSIKTMRFDFGRELCKDLFKKWSNLDESHFIAEKVSGGITNLLLKVSVDEENGNMVHVTVRLYGPNSEYVINRERELQIENFLIGFRSRIPTPGIEGHLHHLLFADRRGGGSSNSGYKKDEYNWRYENDDTSKDINRASVALDNLYDERCVEVESFLFDLFANLGATDEYHISMMEKDDYVGRMLTGRITSGVVRINDRVQELRDGIRCNPLRINIDHRLINKHTFRFKQRSLFSTRFHLFVNQISSSWPKTMFLLLSTQRFVSSNA